MSAASCGPLVAMSCSAARVGLAGLTRWHQVFLQHRCYLPPHRHLSSLHPRPAPPTSVPACSPPSSLSPSLSVSSPAVLVPVDVSADAFPPRHLLYTLDSLPEPAAAPQSELSIASLHYQTLPSLPLPLSPSLLVPPLQPASLHKPRVTVALSGGVDSSVSAFLLREAGYDVRCVYMHNWDERDETGQCSSSADRADAEAVCRQLALPIECVEFVREYWVDVFERMVEGYRSGLTPNPDVWCNREIKFGRLLRWLRQREEIQPANHAVLLATGHYARTQRVYGEAQHNDDRMGRAAQLPYVRTALRGAVDDSLAYIDSLQPGTSITRLTSTFAQANQQQQPDSVTAPASTIDPLSSSAPQLAHFPLSLDKPLLSTRLLTALDPRKDQTYFLSLIPASALPHLLFPLGCLTKPATRGLARYAGLPTASKPDSMGICMIGRRPFNRWLTDYIDVREGRFIDEAGREVGRHKAAEVWTVGQGARLGGQKRRWYVAGKGEDVLRDVAGSKAGDVLVVNDRLHPRLLHDEVLLGEVNWLEGEPAALVSQGTAELYCRLRSTELLRRCEVRRVDGSGSDSAVQYVVRFVDMPHHLVSPGQTCVFYLAEYCLGGGPIVRPGPSYHQQNKRLSFASQASP